MLVVGGGLERAVLDGLSGTNPGSFNDILCGTDNRSYVKPT